MLPRFATVRVEDQSTNLLQDRLKQVLDVITSIPLLDGVTLRDVSLVNGTFRPQAHGLARPWRGFIVTKRTGDVRVWAQAPVADAGAFIYLQASTTATVDIWVF